MREVGCVVSEGKVTVHLREVRLDGSYALERCDAGHAEHSIDVSVEQAQRWSLAESAWSQAEREMRAAFEEADERADEVAAALAPPRDPDEPPGKVADLFPSHYGGFNPIEYPRNKGSW